MITDTVKKFLINKADECEIVIKKYKRKNKIVKILYFTLISLSITGSTIVTVISPLLVSVWIPTSISAITAIVSALSIKFNMERIKNKITKKIQNLNKIKDKLEYVIHCNGDISEDECAKILIDFRDL